MLNESINIMIIYLLNCIWAMSHKFKTLYMERPDTSKFHCFTHDYQTFCFYKFWTLLPDGMFLLGLFTFAWTFDSKFQFHSDHSTNPHSIHPQPKQESSPNPTGRPLKIRIKITKIAKVKT